MFSRISERGDHGVLRLHTRGRAASARVASASGIERPGPSWSRTVDRLGGEVSRRTASEPGRLGVQPEGCFGGLSEWPDESVGRRAARRPEGFRRHHEVPSVFEVSNDPYRRCNRSGRSAAHCDPQPDRKWIAEQRRRGWWRRAAVMTSSSIQGSFNSIKPSTSFLEFR